MGATRLLSNHAFPGANEDVAARDADHQGLFPSANIPGRADAQRSETDGDAIDSWLRKMNEARESYQSYQR
jgi:hypothetical protein